MGFSKTILKTNHDIKGSSAFLFHYNKCNLNCYKCFNQNIINDKNIFTDDEILDIIKESQDFVDYLIFSGGEITLKPDIVEFLTKVKNIAKDCKIIIYTNGTKPDVLENILDIVDGIHLDIKTNVFINDDDLDISNKIYGTNINNDDIIKSIYFVYKYNKGYSQFRTVKYPLNNSEYYDRLYEYITTKYPLIKYKQNPFIEFE
jgi:pyruvate-formate lyase-activating enzyme